MINNRYIGTCWMYEIGVDAGKQRIMDALRVQEPGPHYCHFPKRDDYGARYFAGLLSEHLVYDKDKKQPWVWKKIPGHERNEPLDVRNYALAAYDVLPKDLDAIDRWLQKSRGKAVITPEKTPDAPARRSRVKRRGGGMRNDEW